MTRRIVLAAFGIFAMVIALAAIGALIDPPDQAAANTPRSSPFLKVTIQKSSYEHGYLKLVGVMENTGTAAAVSPSVEIQVLGLDDKTVLGTDVAFPSGTFLTRMEPGDRAAFESFTRVAGEPTRVRWGVSLSRFPGEIIMPK